MLNLLKNRTFILVLAFAAGLVFSDAAAWAGMLTMPALAVVLAVSATQVSLKDFVPLTAAIRPVVLAFLLNYLVLGAVILLFAWWLMPTRDLWIGYVLVAAAPPGIAIIPFTFILRGNLKLSLVGTFGVYLLSLLVTPALVYLFTGEASVSPVRIIYTTVLLILAPFIVSQLINAAGRAAAFVGRWRGPVINWGFFVVVFSVVGLNRDVFLKEHHVLLPVALVAVISVVVPLLAVELLGRKFKIAEPDRNSLLLLSTIKTSAFAAAVGLSFYGEAASVPGAVISAWYALYFIYLGARGGKNMKPSIRAE